MMNEEKKKNSVNDWTKGRHRHGADAYFSRPFFSAVLFLVHHALTGPIKHAAKAHEGSLPIPSHEVHAQQMICSLKPHYSKMPPATKILYYV